MSPSSQPFWLYLVPSSSVITFLLFLEIIPSCLGNDQLYKDCSNRFICGNLNTSFPFWGNGRPSDCGVPGMELRCEDGNNATIEINKLKYRVLDVNEDTQILRIAREDFSDGSVCPPEFVNSTFDPSLFQVPNGWENITLVYGCAPTVSPNLGGVFTCPINGINYQSGYVRRGAIGPGVCYGSVYVPVNGSEMAGLVLSKTFLEEELSEGFEVNWKVDGTACSECIRLGGACGYDDQTTCHCPSGSSTCTSAQKKSGNKNKVSVGVGVGIAGAVVAGLFLGVLIMRRRKRTFVQMQSKDIPATDPPSSKSLTTPSTNLSQSIPSYPSSKSDLGRGSTYFGVQVFNYEELEEATDGFNPSKELGDGGFGTVYYGILKDGRAVAVKRLYENNVKRAEQFMNEVEILARLRHKNLVTLYGCTSKRSRDLLLVYEYIPNGTVADHLHGKESNSGLLPWPVRLSIAIETADALAYLHDSEIIHRDVKTNNILLDNSFRVKVADFGLSRLFPTAVTHVSTAPQGTPGYVDPEYYQCYQLTDKSDVYSFGVVLIELISSLQAVDTNRKRHDINLGTMAINKIQNHELHQLVDPSLGFEKDSAVRRMVISVAELAFRCLQQERDMRPTMAEVLEALRRIQNENYGAGDVVVVDVREDDVGLLKHPPPLLEFSPDSSGVSDSAIPHSF